MYCKKIIVFICGKVCDKKKSFLNFVVVVFSFESSFLECLKTTKIL